ncbi:MAG: DUF1579 domain-containing protein [Bdellovibrionota bacterium]
MKRIYVVAFCAALFGCSHKNAVPSPISEESKQCSHTTDHPAAVAPKPLTPEEMMAKVKAFGTPGKEHEALQPLVGKWTTESKMWMDPSKEPEVSKGTASSEWILGKRFVKQDFSGKLFGKPFQGIGILGYDNLKKTYVSTWIDTMSTGLMVGEGAIQGSSNLEMTNKFSCPLTGGERTARLVTRIVSKDSHVLEMYDTGPDGKTFKTMEIVYKRKH